MSQTPISLLDRLRLKPDEALWKRLVDMYTPFLHQWLRQHGLASEDVDDLVQDVLAVVVRELPDYQHNQRTGAFRRWLRTILVNRLRAFWKARRLRPTAAGGSDFQNIMEQLEDPDSGLARLWDQEHNCYVARRLAFSIEPEFETTTFRAFQRVVMDGKRPADVAAELGISVNAVLIAKSRILRRLRQEVQGFID
jgi:RNA polymerase sigma factor (sigma-70 family)